MPQTDVIFYRDDDGSVPALDWIGNTRRVPAAAAIKLLARVERLAQAGHELRRPEAAPLRDGIYELRVNRQRACYRLLYFFAGQNIAVLSHGCVKEDVVPPVEIDRAIAHRSKFLADPAAHTHRE